MKSVLVFFLFCWAISRLSAQETSMEAPQKFQFQFVVHYNYQDSIPNKEYSLQGKKLKWQSSQYIRGQHDPSTHSDSIQLTDNQLNKLKHYCEKYWNETHYHGQCRALSPVYARIELDHKDKHIREDYAPCQSNVLIEPFTSFQMLLEAIFAEAKKK